MYVCTYPFTLRMTQEIDPIILEFWHNYQIYLPQVSPSIWRTVACLRVLCSRAAETLTLAHLINLYSSKNFRGGMIKLNKRGHHTTVTSVDDDNDCGWMERFIVITTRDILLATTPSIPES